MTPTSETEVIRKQGFVAVLDVLGFSDQVMRDDRAETDQKGSLDDYVEVVTGTAGWYKDSGLNVILFSDTVVLYTLKDTDEAFDGILSACSNLLYGLLSFEIPVRGAIAHGGFVSADKASQGLVIAGRPIIEAHRYESQLQWIGIILAPSVIRRLPAVRDVTPLKGKKPDETAVAYDRRKKRSIKLQRWVEIPLEFDGQTSYFDGYAVIPTFPGAKNTNDTFGGFPDVLDGLRWLKHLAPDSRSQAKYENSIRWLIELQAHWSENDVFE